MITVVVGKEIEKIKGEFESVINGMNMVGEIPYNVYSELFDVGTDYIQKAYELGNSELEAQIEKMQEKLKSDFIKSCKVKEQGFEEAEQALEHKDKQLTKAKEIILRLYNAGRDVLMCRSEEKAYDNLSEAINDRNIEQFLKEIEK